MVSECNILFLFLAVISNFNEPPRRQGRQGLKEEKKLFSMKEISTVMPQEIIEGFRLSPQQNHLWALQQSDIIRPYRVQCTILIEGYLKQKFLGKALQEVVDKHEILRTNFRRLPEMTIPLQVINDSHKIGIHYHNFSSFDIQKQNLKIDALFDEVLHLPLNLEQGSLLYVSLITLSPQKHVLLVSLPSLCADRATIRNLVGEISRFYAACLQGEEFDEEVLQYADFAAWQNELMEAEDTEIGRQYWCSQYLSDTLPLKLPFEKNKIDENKQFQSQSICLTVQPDLVVKITDLVQKYKTSNFRFLLSCWLVLLWRLTSYSNVVVNTAFDGRKYQELEPALGLFAKYLPLKYSLETQNKFSEILVAIADLVHQAEKWQLFFKYEETINENSFIFGFDFEEKSDKYCSGDSIFSIVRQYVCIERFKIRLSCIQNDDSISAEFHYDTRFLSETSVQHLSSEFLTLLESAVNNPETAIASLNILSNSEQQQLLVEFNNTQTDYPLDRCIHHLFEEQVARNPDNVAVVFEDEQLTYRELNHSANQLARYLQQQGVGKETLVGLYVERSLLMVVGILGILKAGGAYLPLDPTLPNERLAFMLEDAKVSFVISHSSLLSSSKQMTVVCLDTDWEAITRCDSENPSSKVSSDNLAYVIYTSGSLGLPKGVLIEHQQLLNYLYSIQKILNLPAGASYATVSTIAADLGNTVIFPSLCGGGCLHIVSSARASDPDALADYFSRYPIDCLKIVPSHLKALLASQRSKRILPQQRLVLGGEAVSWDLIAQIQRSSPDCKIINHYGPTETTVGVTTFEVKSVPSDRQSQTVPIGRAIANTQIYLLDSYQKPVPIGVPGELYIGGAGIARGYLNQPELTVVRFIPNPFENSKSSRLYKTGDLARYLSDGNIEFLGRVDDQVKIHGFRIELGEIEHHLSKHPALKESAVIAREDQLGNKRLVAYIVPHLEQVLTVTDLRNFLQQVLPEYMVPSAFVQLKALPLTPNGKIDRQGLPAPDITRPELKGTFVAPRTPIEEALAAIWAKSLGLEQVGIYDNFFELGGDSILSMQIVAKAKQAGLQFTPKQLFEYQTIAELAAMAGITKFIQAEQGPVTGFVPLTPIQHWFFEQNLLHPHHWNQAVLLEARQPLDSAILEQVLQRLLEHHDALRLRVMQTELGWQQFIEPDSNGFGVRRFTRLDLSALSDLEQQAAIKTACTEFQSSLNLLQGPLMRVALFDRGMDRLPYLLIVIHHLAVDGVSWRILLEDLQTVYEQLIQGKAIQLPPKTTSFKQWAEQLREYAPTAELVLLDYWYSELQKPFSHLPTDYSVRANTVAVSNTVSVALSVEETQALLQKVPTAYQTQMNDVLLTALMQTLERWMRSHNLNKNQASCNLALLVDLEGHGREAIFDNVDVSRTVGWFTTIYPVVVNLEETDTPTAALNKLKQQLRNIPNRGIDYGVLRYKSSNSELKTRLQTLPKAEIRFNYLGQSDQVFSKSSLFSPVLLNSGPTRSLENNRAYLLDINCIVAGGQLQLNWTYSQAIHNRSTIENLAEGFVEALREIITYSQSVDTANQTPLETPSHSAPFTVTSKPLVDFNADAVLDSTIHSHNKPIEHKTKQEHIFLTGVTGFLGAFLLYELLQQTSANIYCLVRSSNTDLGKKKIQSNLESYFIWNESLSDRIIPVVGDLSQPLLGLSLEEFQQLACKLDIIYHNAATTNLIYPYSVLKATNVLGTQEILRLASQIKIKPVHYISTLSVLSALSHSESSFAPELDSLEGIELPHTGYAQTKWVAEKLVMTARDRGIPVCIYRLGRVSGHSQTGVCNTNDRLYRMIKGFIQIGSAPNVDVKLDMTPVDYVSKTIVHLSQHKELLNKVFHICNPQPLRAIELLNWIRSFGYLLQQASNEQWQAELLNDSTEFQKNPLYPLMPFFADMDSKHVNQVDSLEPSSLEFDSQNTLNGLAGTSIVCPPPDANLLHTYFLYLIQIGFLTSPQLNNETIS